MNEYTAEKVKEIVKKYKGCPNGEIYHPQIGKISCKYTDLAKLGLEIYIDYPEFMRRNNETKKEMDFAKLPVSRIEEVDFKHDKCRLSSGQIGTITSLVKGIQRGGYCVSNPSALSGWKDFIEE